MGPNGSQRLTRLDRAPARARFFPRKVAKLASTGTSRESQWAISPIKDFARREGHYRTLLGRRRIRGRVGYTRPKFRASPRGTGPPPTLAPPFVRSVQVP